MFLDEVHDYQHFVVEHLYLLGDQYSLIQEQFHVNNKILDILAYNSLKECLVIIELKNPQATVKAISQITEYFSYLKDSQFDNLIISAPPECLIVAPSFSKKIVLPESPSILLYQLDNNLCEFIDLTGQFKKESVHSLSVKFNRKLYSIPSYIERLIDRLTMTINSYYSNLLAAIKQENKISFLHKETKRIVCKIIIPFDWFTSSIILVLYNQFKDLDKLSFNYDAAILKTVSCKTRTKLYINDIPNFLKSKGK